MAALTMYLQSILSLSINASTLALGIVGYTSALVAYRLWFSPLSKFPGSPLAKATFWYEFYYDWIKPGQYYLKIREMHQTYGPVIQITPEEIHVLDPAHYPRIFVTGGVRKSDSYKRFFRGTPFEGYTSMIRKHDTYRLMRDPMQRFFSTSSIKQVEGVVVSRIKTFRERLAEYEDTGVPVNLSFALMSLSSDVMSAVVCETPTNYLADKKFNAAWFKARRKGVIAVPLFSRLPWPVRPLVLRTLELVSSYLPSSKQYELPGQKTLNAQMRPSSDVKFDGTDRTKTTKQRLGEDTYSRAGELIQQAAIDIPSYVLQAIVTYLALDEERCRTLRTELAAFMKNSHDSNELDRSWQSARGRLPYLEACIKEGLRLNAGVLRRSVRVSPDAALQLDGWTIPKGTPVGMSTYWMHMDPELFPDPHTFIPERWLHADRNQCTPQYFVPFGKGSRDCLGQSLAQMYIHYVLIELFRPGAPTLQPFETDESDVVLKHGYLFSLPSLDSKGVKVLVKSNGRHA
ncbi:cytochrome P450 [Aspergillus unguis]